MAGTKIRGITIELNADTAGILDGLKEINSSLSSTTRSLNDVNKLLKLDPDNVTLLAQKQDYLTEAIEKTKLKLEEEKELLATMQSAENASETVEQQKALEREIEATTQKLNGYETQLTSTTQKLDEMGKEAQEEKQAFKDTSDAIMAMAQSEAFKMIADDAKKLYEALMQCDQAADKFETSMAKVETLAHAGSGLSQMGDEIKNVSASLGVSADEFAEGVYQAMSAGIGYGDAVEFTAQATKLAIGGFTEASTAVDIVTTALNAYGLSVDETAHIMDNLITTQNLGKTTVNELASAMGRVIPTASAYSVNIDNLSAAYAELTAKGIKTRITTTDLNAMFNELGSVGTEVNTIIQELAGQTFGQFMASGHSLGDVMKLLWDYAGKDKEAFYGLWGQTTAATAAFNIASDGGERFNEILTEMQNNAGALNDNFMIMADTSEMLDARWESAVNNLKIAIGDSLGPILDDVKEKGLSALEPVTEFIEANPDLVTALGSIVMGITATTTAVASASAALAVLNMLLEVNPFSGWAIGLTAAVGAIAGFALAMDSITVSTAELQDNIDKNAKTLSSITSSYSEQMSSVQQLASRIKELNSIENLTAEQQLELATCVKQWNDAMGENDQLLLDSTGHLAGNTDALNENFDAALKRYELELKQEELTEIINQAAEAKQNLADAEENYNKVLAENEELVERYPELEYTAAEAISEARDAVLSADETLQGYSERYEELVGDINAGTEAETENTDAVLENASATAEASDAAKEYAEALDKERESLESTIASQVASFEAIKEGSAITKEELINNLESNIEAMESWAENMQTLAERGISDGLLQELANMGPQGAAQVQEFVDMTGDELSRASDAWDEALRQSSLVSGELVPEYMDGGTQVTQAWIDGAWVPIEEGGLDEVATTMAEQLVGAEAWEEMPENMKQHIIDAQMAMIEAVEESEDENAGTALADGTIDGYITETEERAEEVSTATADNVTTPIKDSIDTEMGMAGEGSESAVMITYGESMITSMITGIMNQTEPLKTQMTETMNQTVQAARLAIGMPAEGGESAKFKELGMQIDESIAQGILDNMDLIAQALQEAMDNAINSVDMGAFAGMVSRMIGSMMG